MNGKDDMLKLLVIGIGAGNPEHMTVQAIGALNRADVVFLPRKGESKADLAEWDYGAYEGMTTKQILARCPGWRLFRDGCPDGESAADAGARADRIVGELRAIDGNMLLFSSAHFLRVLAARWLGLPPEGGALLVLDTASISVLGYEHDLGEPVIRRWNGLGSNSGDNVDRS